MVVLFHFTLHASYPGGLPAESQQLLRPFQRIYYYGSTGVCLFFVLSGFLLFVPFASAHIEQRGRPDIRGYFYRRALRILPAYYASMGAVVVFRIVTSGPLPDLAELARHALVAHDWTYQSLISINAPYWTIAVEAQFYLALPILAAVSLRWITNWRRFSSVMLGTAGMSALYRVAHPFVKTHFPVLDLHYTLALPLAYLVVFAIGMSIGHLWVLARHDNDVRQRLERWTLPIGWAGIAVAVLLLAASASGHLPTDNRYLGPGPLTPSVLGPLAYGSISGAILLAVLFRWNTAKRVLASRPMRALGMTAYSTYLLNYILINDVGIPIVRNLRLGFAAVPIAAILCAAVLTLVSSVFYSLFERPYIKRRRELTAIPPRG